MTANRFDHFAKDLLEAVLEHAGSVTVEREVPPTAAQKIDVWFVPDAARADGRKPLGLLGRMVESPSLIEPFHHTPIVDDVRECVRKALNWNHQLARKPEPLEEPVLWVLSAGRPESALRQFAMKPLDAFPRGVYVGPPALRMRLVVLSELPPERDTLLVRLMGAGAVWDQAMTELRALPEDAYERRHALPAIDRWYHLTDDNSENEDKMRNAEQAYEEMKARFRQEGRREGESVGRRFELQRLFARRLGRTLSATEEAVLLRRFDDLGPDRLGDLVLELDGPALAAWLAEPGAT